MYDRDMLIKYLPIGLVVILMVGAVGFLIISRSNQAPKLTPAQSLEQLVKNQNIATAPIPEKSDADRLRTLEEVVTALAQKVNVTPSASQNTSLEDRVKTLEKEVDDLQLQVGDVQPTATQQAAAPTVAKSPVYIPLGWTGSSSVMDWTVITTQSFTFDPADYSGYSGVTFEASIRPYQGNGKAFARLYNSNDGTAILNSEVSSATENYTWVSSSSFKFSSAKKTYQLQLKSLTGYAAEIQNARLKISF